MPALLGAGLLSVWPFAGVAAEGLLEAVSGHEEMNYSLLSTKTTDATGATTKTRIDTGTSRTNVKLNYYLLPTVNINAGGTYERDLSKLSGDSGAQNSDTARFRPYVWLNFHDPVLDAAAGYDLSDDRTQTSGQSTSTLTRETYNANARWRPADLPATQFRYTRSSTRDGGGASIDTVQDLYFLKSEYVFRGLNAHYVGTLTTTNDRLHDTETTQKTQEGTLLYATVLLDGRVTINSDNRIRSTEVTFTNGQATTVAGFESPGALAVVPVDALSLVNDNADTLALTPHQALLINSDTTTSAGINLGFPGAGVLRTKRQIGLDFGAPTSVNRLWVWIVDPDHPSEPTDITGAFSWSVYTSADNVNWTLVTTIPVATFGPFDQRFELNFPTVTARYVKAVTLPLSGGVVGSTNSSLFPNIFITELQAFVDRTVAGQGAAKRSTTITQTVRTHNFDVKSALFRSPSLYYNLSGAYQETDPGALTRYSLTNGLFLTHRLSRIFAVSANASVEIGKDQTLTREDTHTAFTYYASLAATPLRSLTDSLVFNGAQQRTSTTTTTNNSLVLYNTAQLYRGIDTSLNLGGVLTSDTPKGESETRRRDVYANVGVGITPHPALTTTAYLFRRMSHAEGATVTQPDTTETRLDLGLTFTPFRTLVLSAAANIAEETGKDTTIARHYGLNWAPFPDGNLQFSFFYAESHLADASSRIIQPSVRWYVTSRRRTYVEATYQLSTSDGPSSRTESQLFSLSLNTYF